MMSSPKISLGGSAAVNSGVWGAPPVSQSNNKTASLNMSSQEKKVRTAGFVLDS